MAKIPPFTPYVVPQLSSAPWLPDVAEHRNSFENWSRNARQARRRATPQELPIQSFLLYQLRFIVAGECCMAFRPFGGMCAQLNLLAIVLNLCVTESVSLGLGYFRILSSRLEENARMRVIAPNDFFGLLSTEQLDVKEQARRELSLSFRGNGFQPRAPPATFPRGPPRGNGRRSSFNSSGNPNTNPNFTPTNIQNRPPRATFNTQSQPARQ